MNIHLLPILIHIVSSYIFFINPHSFEGCVFIINNFFFKLLFRLGSNAAHLLLFVCDLLQLIFVLLYQLIFIFLLFLLNVRPANSLLNLSVFF